jgi:hypothetical protein
MRTLTPPGGRYCAMRPGTGRKLLNASSAFTRTSIAWPCTCNITIITLLYDIKVACKKDCAKDVKLAVGQSLLNELSALVHMKMAKGPCNDAVASIQQCG